jgi:hypothetical protein
VAGSHDGFCFFNEHPVGEKDTALACVHVAAKLNLVTSTPELHRPLLLQHIDLHSVCSAWHPLPVSIGLYTDLQASIFLALRIPLNPWTDLKLAGSNGLDCASVIPTKTLHIA